jgi:hypothetical protein
MGLSLEGRSLLLVEGVIKALFELLEGWLLLLMVIVFNDVFSFIFINSSLVRLVLISRSFTQMVITFEYILFFLSIKLTSLFLLNDLVFVGFIPKGRLLFLGDSPDLILKGFTLAITSSHRVILDITCLLNLLLL